jgi:hypothetical protein
VRALRIHTLHPPQTDVAFTHSITHSICSPALITPSVVCVCVCVCVSVSQMALATPSAGLTAQADVVGKMEMIRRDLESQLKTDSSMCEQLMALALDMGNTKRLTKFGPPNVLKYVSIRNSTETYDVGARTSEKTFVICRRLNVPPSTCVCERCGAMCKCVQDMQVLMESCHTFGNWLHETTIRVTNVTLGKASECSCACFDHSTYGIPQSLVDTKVGSNIGSGAPLALALVRRVLGLTARDGLNIDLMTLMCKTFGRGPVLIRDYGDHVPGETLLIYERWATSDTESGAKLLPLVIHRLVFGYIGWQTSIEMENVVEKGLETPNYGALP